MRLLAHVIATDLRRFRWTIAAYLAVTVATAGLELARPGLAVSVQTLAATGVAGGLLWLARLLITIFLVPLIVQAHPLVGSDAFWMTRPIAPRLLLASKVLLLSVLIVVVPVACELIMMALYDVPARQMSLVVLQTTLTRTLLLVALMSAASLTRNLAGFAGLCGGALIAAALVMAILLAIAVSKQDEGSGVLMVSVSAPLPPDVGDATGLAIFMVVLVGAGLALLAVQYHVRLRQRSVPAGLGGVAAAWALATVWPWPLLVPRLVVPDWARAAEVLQLTADPASVRFPADHVWSGENRRQARGDVRLSGLPPSWRATVRLAEATLDLGANGRLDVRGFGFGESVNLAGTDPFQERAVMRDLLGVDHIAGLERWEPDTVTVMVLRDADFRRHRGAAGSYSATFFIDLSRHEVAATLPLRPGARYQRGADRFVIDDVRYGPGLTVRLRRSGTATMFDLDPRPAYSFFFRNQARKQAATVFYRPLLQAFSAIPMGFTGFSLSQSEWGFQIAEDQLVRFEGADSEKENAVPFDEAWFAAAELVIVRTTRYGSVARPLTMTGVSIDQKGR